MSSSVSQIEYWLGADKKAAGANQNSNSEEGGDGAAYLSYNVLLGLSVIGGFFALDHLYLRSPLTFVAKLLINIFFFGVWWLWDALQAIFNRDVIKVFGIGIPSLGPKGIAAGVLANDVPDKKHMAFFIYGLALILGGIFGIDSFIVGDKTSGLIRLVSLITGIFAPIAIVWWLYNLGIFMFSPKTVTNTYWEYFGAPQPFDQTLTLGQKILIKFPFLQNIFGPAIRVKDAAIRTAKGVVATAEQIAEATLIDPIGTAKRVIVAPVKAVEATVDEAVDKAGELITGPLTKAVDTVQGKIKPAVDAALVPITGAITTAIQPVLAVAEPFKETLDTGLSVAQTGLSAVEEGLALGKSAVNAGSDIAGKTLNVVGDTAKAATAALALAPMAAGLPSQLTPSSIGAAKMNLMQGLPQAGGGSSSNVLPYVLMGTLAIIAVSGLILTYRRSRQNERPRKDDSPPEPGVLRESDKKESS